MAFNVPTLSDVSRMVDNGFSSAFYGKSGSLRVGFLKVLSKVVAGAAYLPILFCQYIWKNSFVDSADAENLVRFGQWYNVPHKVASYSRGYVTIRGTAQVPAGTILQDQNGIAFETLSTITATNSGVDVQVVALEIGSASNVDPYQSMTFRDEDIANIVQMLVTGGGLNGGVSVEVSVDGSTEYWGETIEEYRSRIKYRRQHPPMGGADSDYLQWALKFPSVTDAWVFGNYPFTNSVAVYLANFNSNTAQLNAADVKEISDFINSDNRRPITADVRVASVVGITIGLTIAIPVLNDQYKNAVADVLNGYLRKFAPGETFTLTGCKTAIVSSGVVDDCEVSNMIADGLPVQSGSYTLSKGASTSGTPTISGKAVNIAKLKDNLTFTLLT